MNIQTKKLPKNLVELLVEMSFQEMEPFYQRTLEEISQEIKIPGFRPGKAPFDLIKKEVDEMKILEQGAEMAINEKYPEILKEQQIIPAAPPMVQIQKLAPNNPCVFKLTISLMPNVKLGDYKKIKIKKNKIEVKNEEIENVVEDLRRMRGKETLVNREIKNGDKAQIDLNLFVDKVPLENGQIKDFSFIVGQDQYLPGLSENLKDLKKNDEKEFSFNYPSDHYDKKLAGKKVDFKAKIKEIYQIDLPEPDDKFAQMIGPFKTINELTDKIRKDLFHEQEYKEEQRREIEILNQLINISNFEEIPDILIEHESDKMLVELQENIEKSDHQGSFKFEDYLKAIKKTEKDLRNDFVPQAEKRIKTALTVREIALKEKIEAGDEEIEKETEELKKVYQNQKTAMENLESEMGKIYIKNLVVNRKVIEWLKNKCL